MKYTLLSIAFAIAILCSCSSEQSPKQQREALEQKVLAVHDTAMAKMEDIYHLRKNLRTLRDSLEAHPQPDSSNLNNLQTHIQLLNRADEAMMGWMHQYKAPKPDQEDKQALNYLQEQLIKIEKVKIKMDSSIRAAESTEKSYEKNHQ